MHVRQLISLLLISFAARAQSLLPQVFSSSGSFFTQSQGSLSITIGELAEINTFTQQSISLILTQGFQQNDFRASLPLRLIAFNGQRSGEAVNLEWKVTGESEGNLYTVLRSSNDRNYLPVGNLLSNARIFDPIYHFKDRDIQNGDVFYKIRIVESSGIRWDSWVIRIKGSTVVPRVYPNPARDQIQIVMTHDRQENRSIELWDGTGKNVRRFMRQLVPGVNTVTFNLQGLPSGSYWLRGMGERAVLIIKE